MEINSKEIELINNNNQIVVSSRQVATNFGKQHKDVLDSIREILAAENSAARFFCESHYENRGKQYPEYLMTRDGFTILAMGFNGKKAMMWKLKYIEAFNSMENQLKVINLDSYRIDDPIERAKKWIAEQEAKDKQIAQRDETIALLQPKADLADKLAGHKGLLKVGEAAQVLDYKGYGQNNLFKLLYRRKVLIDSSHAYQPYVNRGYVKQIERPYTDPNTGEEKMGTSIRVTQRGMEFLDRLVRADINAKEALALADEVEAK